MIAQQNEAGIDVGKAWLDVQIGASGVGLRVANDPGGWRQLLARLQQSQVARVGLEASGGYERQVAATLAKAGFAVVLCDPGQVRAFARAMKVRAKTDPIDAAMIVRYLGAAGELPLWRPDPARDRLGELASLRRQLLQDHTLWTQRLEQTGAPLALRLIRHRLTRLKADMALVEAEITRHIKAYPDLHRIERAYRAIPAVGPVLATALITELPELGTIGSRQIAALVGVAPHPRQSGKTDRGGTCAGGRTRLRNVLYMATLSAIKARHNRLFPFYQRLRRNGKPFNIAIVATMRKFLTILNAITRDKTLYTPPAATVA